MLLLFLGGFFFGGRGGGVFVFCKGNIFKEGNFPNVILSSVR